MTMKDVHSRHDKEEAAHRYSLIVDELVQTPLGSGPHPQATVTCVSFYEPWSHLRWLVLLEPSLVGSRLERRRR